MPTTPSTTPECPALGPESLWPLIGQWLAQLDAPMALLVLALAGIAAWSLWQRERTQAQSTEAMRAVNESLQRLGKAMAVLLDRGGRKP